MAVEGLFISEKSSGIDLILCARDWSLVSARLKAHGGAAWSRANAISVKHLSFDTLARPDRGATQIPRPRPHAGSEETLGFGGNDRTGGVPAPDANSDCFAEARSTARQASVSAL